MKNTILTTCLALALSSCSLTSTTVIGPKDSFVLGNNPHRAFKVSIVNASNFTISSYHAPIGGGTHSPLTLAPNAKAKIKVDKNTALVISNSSADTATVKLKVTGDTGLSMGYKN
ncbi:MAG: hypothetical protein EAY75_17985 [Bacteroidetes bacterium]|nr:MAG: hypothetical protein EAY75_17985 [Bacteroidota bacterium]